MFPVIQPNKSGYKVYPAKTYGGFSTRMEEGD